MRDGFYLISIMKMRGGRFRATDLVGELLQAHDDVLAVRVTAQLSNVFTNITQNGGALALIAHVNHFLHHVVGVGVAHHRLEHAVALVVDGVGGVEGVVDDAPDHLVAVAARSVLQALLHHVGGKLVLREVEQVLLDLADEHCAIGLPAVLHDELDDVVAIAVLHELRAVLAQLLEDGSLLGDGAVLEDALNDAAAVGVRAQLLDAAEEDVDDELDAGREVVHLLLALLISGHAAHDLNNLLDDVVAVRVVHAAEEHLFDKVGEEGGEKKREREEDK